VSWSRRSPIAWDVELGAVPRKVSKMRDYPLLGIPIYVIFDPRTGEGAVFSEIHSTPAGPRYATRKDFVYGEDVTIADWTIPTHDLPRYQSKGGVHPEQ
jgi:hypothetical protein